MDTSELLTQTKCSCGLNFGLETLSSKNVEETKKLITELNLLNQKISFLGANCSRENCKIKDKIDEITDKIGEYYFDKENKKLIAIPNQIKPDKPFIFNPEKTYKKKKNVNNSYSDTGYENKLHLEIVNVARKMNEYAFIMKSFRSEDCFRAEKEMGKTIRKNSKCNCKAQVKCKCGKAEYPELNKNEENILDLIDIKVLEKERLERCSELFRNMKLTETDNKTTSVTKEITSQDRRLEVDCEDVKFLNEG